MADYGLDIAIPFTGDPDPTLPWADDDDALLVPGSLALFDAAHSASPMASGSPAIGADIPNIAWKRFRDAVGFAVFTGRVDSGTAGTAGNVLTVTAVAAGTIAVGQLVTGTGTAITPVGTSYITGQLTGTPGGIGTYSTSAATTNNTGSVTITASPIDATSGGLTFTGVADLPASLVTERSGKGGVHVTVSQTSDNVNSAYKAIEGKNALKAYITANRSHSFYISQWMRITRAATVISTQAPINGGIGAGGTNYITQLLQAASTGTLQSAASPIGQFYDPAVPNLGVTGNSFRANGAAGPGNGSGLLPILLDGWGLVGSYSNAGTYGNKSASYIAYRSYVEDLTVSGRSFAQVQAQDYALWQAAFAAGGRYAGDTFTAPAI